LHQVELGSADPVQLNGRGYTVDHADWSTTLGLRANYNDVTVTHNAYETFVTPLSLRRHIFTTVQDRCMVMMDHL